MKIANEFPSCGANPNKSTMAYFTDAWKVPIMPGAEGMANAMDESTKTIRTWGKDRLK